MITRRWLVAIMATIGPLMCSTMACAQNGVWYSDDTDGVDIDTDIFASPAYSPLAFSPGNIMTFSSLNGSPWQEADAHYPQTTSIFQQVLNAGAGEYPWTTYYVLVGWTGRACGVIYVSPQTTDYLSIKVTNYKWTGSYNSAGWCEYDLWCAEGVTPTCGASDDPIYVQADPAAWPGGCSTWYHDSYLAYRLNKSSPFSCLHSIGEMTFTAYACN
jgi:hypothetical protein